MANRLGVYLDESATDSDTPIAVVAGLLLDWNRYTYLDIEWQQALASYGMKTIHMKNLGKRGQLGGVSVEDRRKLFARLARIINDHKGWTIASTLSAEEHKTHFGWLGEKGWSQYATCFLMAAVQQGKQLESESYPYGVLYTMDDGNPYKDEVIEAHGYIVDIFQKERPYHVGALEFDTDSNVRALQAADVIAWAVRRRAVGLTFKGGTEPLEEIFQRDHLQQAFKAEWMIEVSNTLKKRQNEKAKALAA